MTNQKLNSLMCQRCKCQTLSNSASGRVVLYGESAPDDCHNIVLQFNNITQCLCYEDFLALEWNMRSIDIAAFFANYPNEDRIHLSTPSPYLNFSFRAGEMQELKQLLGNAVARLDWHEMLKKSSN